MNDPTTAESTLNRFAIAVRNFTPKVSQKFQILLPFKEGIGELRRKGASYETIADILRNNNVNVSHDTMARFCHKVLKLAPPRRRSRRASRRTVEQPLCNDSQVDRAGNADHPCTA